MFVKIATSTVMVNAETTPSCKPIFPDEVYRHNHFLNCSV